MKLRLLEFLVCPTCGGDLKLDAFSQECVEMAEGPGADQGRGPNSETVIKEGWLCCAQCRIWYPILEYVPVMLTFPTGVHQRFAEKHQERLAALSGYTMPKGKPDPGEKAVQETFSDEWDQLQNSELSFSSTANDLVELNRQVWLKPLQSTRERFKTVLNVGVGLGQETIALQKAIGNAEIFGVDLNFALLQRGAMHRSTPAFHLVIASLFHLPFRRSSFDVVYSQGVIHHTYSTRAAFDAISAFVNPRGNLFIWVYSLDAHLVPKGFKGFVLRMNWQAEHILRPLVSRAPKFVRDAFFAVLSTVLHPLVKTLMPHQEKWRWCNTNHGMRDWLSPRYAHRHSYNEVLEWFEEQGFAVVAVQSPAAYRRLFGKQFHGVGVLGERILTPAAYANEAVAVQRTAETSPAEVSPVYSMRTR